MPFKTEIITFDPTDKIVSETLRMSATGKEATIISRLASQTIPKDLTVTTATQAINKVGTEAKIEFQKVGSGYSGEGHEGGMRIPDTVVPTGTYDGQNISGGAATPPAPPVQGFFATMWDSLSQMVSNAAGNVTNFFKQKNDAGELTEDPNYYRIAGVTVFFALLVLGIYKLIKWFKLRKEEQTVETFNQSYKEYKTQIKENINFFNSLNKKFLKEDVEQSQNATVNKALDLAPQVAAYALEANEKKEETKSIFKKYGYWILGAIAGFVVIGLYAYFGYGNEHQKVGSGWAGEGHEGGTRIPDTVVPRGTYNGNDLTDTGPTPPTSNSNIPSGTYDGQNLADTGPTPPSEEFLSRQNAERNFARTYNTYKSKS